MQRVPLLSLVILVFCICTNSFAASLQAPIDQIINKTDPQINMGMVVVDLSTGETLYTKNAKKTFTPASNMKLFSEAAALILFGPGYTFQTKLSTDATSLNNGILNGSLFLHLSGDPSFTQKDLSNLFSKLPDWGIKEITGNFIIVSNNRNIKPHAPGVNPKDLDHSYGAPTTPVVLDENRVTITVNPSATPEKHALVEYSSGKNIFILDNQIKTKTKGHCGVGAKITKKNHLLLQGCIRKNSQAIQIVIPISKPLNYAKSIIKSQLKSMDIKLDGKVILGKSAKPNLLIAKHSSKPITQLMANTLKYSDNLYADSLFLHTAEKINGAPANWQQAEAVIKKFLEQQTKINLQNAVLIDGSGLSIHDLVTPEQTIGLLKYIHNRFPLAYEYITALPIAGQDGTLFKRFRKPTQKGLLRAKTGSLTGVMSLSGYLYTSNAHTLAFTIYINTKRGTKPSVSGKYLSMVDSLCAFLLQQKPENKFINSIESYNKQHIAFQEKPSKTERDKYAYAKWRNIERILKNNLNTGAETILFRNDNILIIDNNKDTNKVWSALQEARKKYSFSVGLKTKTSTNNNIPVLLWIDNKSKDNKRVWYIQEAAG